MQPSIPNSHAISSAFHRLEKRLNNARKKVNAAAAKEMKADDYETAQKWMEVGRSLADFAERVAAFTQEWKRFVKATTIAAKAGKVQQQKEEP